MSKSTYAYVYDYNIKTLINSIHYTVHGSKFLYFLLSSLSSREITEHYLVFTDVNRLFVVFAGDGQCGHCGHHWGVATPTMLLLVMTTLLHATRAAVTRCPVSCVCNTTHGMTNCSNRRLTLPPSHVSSSTRHLDLSHNFLVTLDDATTLGDLHLLRSLDLSFNDLVNVSSDALCAQRRLLRLSLADNHLDGEQLTTISLLTALKELDLSGNVISTIDTNVFDNLTHLRTLNLNQNAITFVTVRHIIATLPQLETLRLDGNQLQSLSIEGNSSLQYLSLSHNQLSVCPDLSTLPNLTYLDLSHNRITVIDSASFNMLTQLRWLSIASNAVTNIGIGAFCNCSQLEELHLTLLDNLMHINNETFTGLTALLTLNVSHNKNLRYIHAEALTCLMSLQTLDLSYNALSSLHKSTLQGLTRLHTVTLHHNPWNCNCDTWWLHNHLIGNTTAATTWRLLHPDDIVCAGPSRLAHYRMADIQHWNISCTAAMIQSYDHLVAFPIGSQAIINCKVDGDPKPEIVWLTPRRKRLYYHPAFVNHAVADPGDNAYLKDKPWHLSHDYDHDIDKRTDGRMRVLKNGSLYIDYVSRHDTGHYYCLAHNSHGNGTAAIVVLLDYTIIEHLTFISMLIGVATDMAFLVGVAVFMLTRLLVVKCRRRQQKLRSVHNLLDTIQGYKSNKIATLCAFKSDKFVKLSAKITQLRMYRQDAAAGVFQHIENMREQYAARVARIRENCTQQMTRLHESYGAQVGRFKDYKSTHLDSMKDNYAQRVQRIRDYGTQQLEKLREQYKMQQSHMLKLVELLDIGNCLHGIEAECKRTESMLFNGDVIDASAFPASVINAHTFPTGRATGELSTFHSQTELSDSDSFKTASVNGDDTSLTGSCTADCQMCSARRHAHDPSVNNTDDQPYGQTVTDKEKQRSDSIALPLLSVHKLHNELVGSPTKLSVTSDTYSSSQYDSAVSQTESPVHSVVNFTPPMSPCTDGDMRF